MGILDEAIREHLELKRQHGADESELKGLEDEAFGPADRPDATAAGEAETQIISPGSSLTSPPGEGDQLDKVFDAKRQAEAAQSASETGGATAETEAPAEPEATFAEHPIPEPPAPAEPEADTAPEPTPEPEATDQATVESPEAKPPEPEASAEKAAETASPAEEGDAGDMLEAERHHLASHPTEHYDVDAAIAEEDEIDVLSESSLSDELDRALDSGEVESAGQTVEPDTSAEPGSGELETADDSADDPATGEQAAEEEPDTGEDEADGQADFFDQDDVLEATPDFLEETPEHDQLWFEQKEPKDFDFGD